MMTRRIPSSSAFTYCWTYIVFLSFRGIDTREGFTGHLYKALCDKGIETFIDDEELQKGEEITPALVKAIEQSRIAIVIFSENYASSAFCLKELVKIIELMEQKLCFVWPVFYKVDPSDVRYQKGTFGEAFNELIEKRFKNNINKVKKWKSTLKAAADLSGWHFHDGYEYEYKFISNIIDEVSKKTTRIPLHVANHPVGLESQVKRVKTLLQSEPNGVNMVGIYGIGGIGKTTIACAMYNLIADHFEGLCFLSDIRENSTTKHDLAQLQKKLLIDILGLRDIKLENVKEGITIIKHRLRKKKVLLILDDVNKLEQLQTLAGEPDWFGSGSNIIVTTRDKHLLDAHGVVQKYEVEELNHEEALELFSWNAFKKDKVDPSYLDLSKDAISYSSGLPLALEIIGSNLCRRSREAWVSALTQYRRTPNNVIFEKLKISYDSLDEDHQKIFLDLACVFKGFPLKHVIDTFQHGRGLDPTFGFEELVDRSLIKIDMGRGIVTMHDLIQDMGRKIVKQESPLNPERRSRLSSSTDIIKVLEGNLGGESIEVMMVDLPPDKIVQWDGMAFENMKNLEVLIIKYADFSTKIKYLPTSLRLFEWEGCPFRVLPTNLFPRNLVTLRLSNSCAILDGALEKFKSLRDLNLSGNKFLTQIPDISGAPNLEKLTLDYCLNLIEVHDSVGNHSNLKELNAEGCTTLSIFPRHIMMKSLEILNFDNCSSFKIFPEISGKMEKLRSVWLSQTGIENLPFSIQNLVGLEDIYVDSHDNRPLWLPSSILTLPKLHQLYVDKGRVFSSSGERYIKLCNCNFIYEFLPARLPFVSDWEKLKIELCDFVILPVGIKEFPFLKELVLFKCTHLWEIRWLPPSLKKLELIECEQLREIKELPPNIEEVLLVNCTSLVPETSSILLSEKFHEVRSKSITMPGTRIPGWFDHYNMGPSLSFWCRKKFPSISVCTIVSTFGNPMGPIFIILIINGTQQISLYVDPFNLKPSKTDHISVLDLKTQLDEHGLRTEPGWNHVEIFGMTYESFFTTKWKYVKGMAVYVYKQENNMEDVYFTSTSNPPHKRKFDHSEAKDPSIKYLFPLVKNLINPDNYSFFSSLYVPFTSKHIWHMQALPVIKLLLWEISEGGMKMPTYGNLFKRKIIGDPLCPICGEKDETVKHVFFLCPWTRPIWFGSEFQWTEDDLDLKDDFHLWDSTDSFLFPKEKTDEWFSNRFDKIKSVHPNYKQAIALVGCICWAIWNERKDFVSGGQLVCPKHALDRAKTMHKQCLEETIFHRPWFTYEHQFEW